MKAKMWIHFTVEMEVEAETEDKLYLEAIEKMDDLQSDELTAAIENARCYGKKHPRNVAEIVEIDFV